MRERPESARIRDSCEMIIAMSGGMKGGRPGVENDNDEGI